MSDVTGENDGRYSGLVAAMLALVFLFPSIRAYVPAVPRAMYFAPLLVLATLALVRIWHRPRSKFPFTVILYVTLGSTLCLWLMMSSFWTISTTQFPVDLALLGTILILILSCSVLIDTRTIEILLVLIFSLAAMIGLLVVGEFLLLGNLQAFGTHLYRVYLTVAHLLGLAATGAAVRYLVPGPRSWVWSIFALVLFMELALSLARGALLSALMIFIISSILILLYQLWRNPGYRSWVDGATKFFITFLLGLATIVMAMQIERTKVRLMRLFSGTELEEGGRGMIWREALRNIQDSPWTGFGLSSNGPLSMGREIDYPHNLFLQVWLDGGIPALILLTLTLSIPLFAFLRTLAKKDSGHEYLLFPLVGIFTFLFLEYSKSGNFYTSRDLFLFGLFIVILADKTSVKRTAR